jgi:predicted TPR repeat methyltransferase
MLLIISLLIASYISLPVCCSGDVSEAINICRDKLKDDPHFPKVQHSLAQLLDSQLSDDADISLVAEVVQLYRDVGNPHADVDEKRIPPAKVRFESLMRAAHMATDILRDNRQAISYYLCAMHIDGVDEAALLVAFEETLRLLLSPIKVELGESLQEIAPNGMLGAIGLDPLQLSIELCDYVETKCPEEPLVYELRGATLRQLKQPEMAYQSYNQALIKARERYHKCSQQGDEECFVELKGFIKSSILAAAVAREAGISFDHQMSYLKAVEQFAAPILSSTRTYEGIEMQMEKDDLVKEMVELYNNMGILEKKRGANSQAKLFFKKALKVNPKDGHALVQLASISTEEDEQIISEVLELDREYVAGLFDGYSSRFEIELVDVLKYKGHLLVYEALRDALEDSDATSIHTIIDLGCGTGLLGEQIATEMPWVAIHGCDLSQRMVDISLNRRTDSDGKRSVYTTVRNLDANEFLSNFGKESVDCVVASDVFIYVGDISSILDECSKRLVKGGLVGFTVESIDSGMRLLPSGRFGHSRQYIYHMAETYGFQILSWKDAVLRQQAGSDVNGSVVVMKRI